MVVGFAIARTSTPKPQSPHRGSFPEHANDDVTRKRTQHGDRTKAPAVRQVEDQQAARRQPLVAGPQRGMYVGDVFDDVVAAVDCHLKRSTFVPT